jgi:hypothetical protein
MRRFCPSQLDCRRIKSEGKMDIRRAKAAKQNPRDKKTCKIRTVRDRFESPEVESG